jgi:inosose dehydratase
METRKTISQRLSDTGLKLGALMGLPTPAEEVGKQKENLDWFKRLLELAHELRVDDLPLIQGVLGGGKWEQKKNLFRDQVGQWLELAVEAGIILSIKPHRGHAMSTPDNAVWMIHELGDKPNLRMVYDYSHYAFRDMPIEATVATALPYTSYVVMKDAVQEDGKVVFELPGQMGTIDHARVLSLFYKGGYRGEICPEVSSLVWRAEGYDPEGAARTCYHNLSNIFSEAGVGRIGRIN